MAYNMTMISNETTITELLRNVNTELMFGYLGIILLVALFFILFINFYNSNSNIKIAFAFSCSISFIFAVFLRILNIINDRIMTVTLLALGIGVAILVFNRD